MSLDSMYCVGAVASCFRVQALWCDVLFVLLEVVSELSCGSGYERMSMALSVQFSIVGSVNAMRLNT